uniref:Uncharacterized protein n=1 Tax=Mustela putorius furo TaxID=9669 RepID=M3Y050_MUSPF
MRQARWTPRRGLQGSGSEGTHPRPAVHPPSFLPPAQPRASILHPPTHLPAFIHDPQLPPTHPRTGASTTRSFHPPTHAPEHRPSPPPLLPLSIHPPVHHLSTRRRPHM